MQLKPFLLDYDKDVCNGDVGIVERVDLIEQQVAIRFDDRVVKYDFGEMDEVSMAYAVTIHKSQGSGFPAIVIPAPFRLERRRSADRLTSSDRWLTCVKRTIIELLMTVAGSIAFLPSFINKAEYTVLTSPCKRVPTRAALLSPTRVDVKLQ